MRVRYVNLMTLIALVLSLFIVGRVQAKGFILKVTVTGPGLDGAVEFTDEERLSVFKELEFVGPIAKPQSAETQPYFEISLAIGYKTEVFMTEVYHYYPASGDSPAYIHAPGFIHYADNGEPTSEKGAYFLLSEKTNRALSNLLADLGASIPNQPNTAWIPPLAWFFACCCFFIIAGKIVKLKRSVMQESTVTQLPN